jgi:RNA polymerase sigma-70 factor (ECF subfamily)
LRDFARLSAWLRQLAVRQAMLYRRGKGRRLKLVERQAERSVDTTTREIDPLDWLIRGERAVLVRDALARLPSRDAEVLLLKYVEGWSYQTLAEHMEVSESAIEARLHRARAKLRNALADRPEVTE